MNKNNLILIAGLVLVFGIGGFIVLKNAGNLDEEMFPDENTNMERPSNGMPRTDGSGSGPANGTRMGEGKMPEIDFAQSAEILGITEEELLTALGERPYDFENAAETLNVTVEDLQTALGINPMQRPNDGERPENLIEEIPLSE